jgi:hypothetical protein
MAHRGESHADARRKKHDIGSGKGNYLPHYGLPTIDPRRNGFVDPSFLVTKEEAKD